MASQQDICDCSTTPLWLYVKEKPPFITATMNPPSDRCADTHTTSWQFWYHKAAPTAVWNKPTHLTTIQSITSPPVKEPAGGWRNMEVLLTYQGQGHHVGTPSVCHRAAAWDPHRCTHAHLDWLTQWHATWSHSVVSEMHIDETSF